MGGPWLRILPFKVRPALFLTGSEKRDDRADRELEVPNWWCLSAQRFCLLLTCEKTCRPFVVRYARCSLCVRAGEFS
jgi:hypothetical protein